VTATLALGAISIHGWYREIQHSAERVHPAVLEWSASSVRARVEDARRAAAQIADAVSSTHDGATRAALAAKILSNQPILSGVVFLENDGRVRGSAGAGPELDDLLSVLTTQSAVDAGLDDAMAAAQLRRELSAVDAPSRRILVQSGETPVVVVSKSLVDRSGRTRGSVHGLVRATELAAALRHDLLGAGAIRLADEEGRVVAQAGGVTNGPQTMPPEALHASASPHINVPWDSDGAWSVRSAAPVDVLDLAIVAEQPILVAFESLAVAAFQLFATGGALALAFVIAASAMAARSTRRLQALLDGLRSVARRDFSTRLPDDAVRGQLEFIYRGFNDMSERLAKQAARDDVNVEVLAKQNAGFQKQHDALAKLSVTDGLTKLHNHRYFQDQLSREIKRLSRTNEGLSILIIDVDDFKKLNDTYGHAAGDEFLKQLAQILQESVRETDLLARYGGEEFVIVAIGTTLEGALLLAEKLRMRVAETSFIVDETMRPRGVTVSIGVAQFGHSRTELFTAADSALYRAKAAGKNCVVAAEPHADEGQPG